MFETNLRVYLLSLSPMSLLRTCHANISSYKLLHSSGVRDTKRWMPPFNKALIRTGSECVFCKVKTTDDAGNRGSEVRF